MRAMFPDRDAFMKSQVALMHDLFPDDKKKKD